MEFHRTLDAVFRSWTHIAVLRALHDTTVGFTGNQVARQARMHPRSAFKALGTLEMLGMIHRRRGGRDHLFTLNRAHVLITEGVLPVLEVERRLLADLEAMLKQLLSRNVIACILFGSVARGEEGPESDVDLCCIVRSPKEKSSAEQALDDHAGEVFEKFGAKIAPVFFTVTEFRAKRSTPLMKSMLLEGRTIAGKIPK
jgi:predicted nucleotidyltransferase